MTDFRALCAELAESVETLLTLRPIDSRPLHTTEKRLDRARAALAEPEPEVVGPTDKELLETLDKATADFPPRHPEAESLNAVEYPLALELRKARAVLARYGHQPAPPAEGEVGDESRHLARELRDQADDLSPSLELFGLIHRAADLLEQRHPTPVPVSERLPGDQLCWWFEADEDCGYGSNWTLLRIRGSATGYTYWLPATALPLPQGEVE